VNPALIAVAVTVGAGAIIAVSSRDARAAFIGLAMVLVGASFLVDPLPQPATLGVRIIGGLLCIAILRLAASDRETDHAGSPLGWPAEAFLAIAAAVGGAGVAVGIAVSGSGFQELSREAVAAAVGSPSIVIIATAAAVLAIGLTPALLGRAGFGRTVGLVLVTVAATLVLVGFAGPPNDLQQVAIAGLLVGGAAGGVGLARAAAAATGTRGTAA